MTTLAKFFLIFLLSIFFYACSGEQDIIRPDTPDSNAHDLAQDEIPLLPEITGPNVWRILADQSYLRFSGRYNDKPFEGRFEEFIANIRFDPENIATTQINALIFIDSFRTGNADMDGSYEEKNWFHPDQYAFAEFISDKVTESSPGRYISHGKLRIKGVEKQIALPFSLRIEGDRSIALGEVTLNRMDFNLGTGNYYEADSFISHAITAELQITALRAGDGS